MDHPIVLVSSDSETEIEEDNIDSVDPVDRINSSSQININTAGPSHSRDVQSRPVETQGNGCKEEKISISETDPLFKIIFRDKITSRKYRRRMEDITKYMLTSKLDEEDSSNASASDLVLEIFDPTIENNRTETCLTQDIKKESSRSIERDKRKMSDNIVTLPTPKRIKVRRDLQNNFNSPYDKDLQNWNKNVNSSRICVNNCTVKIGTYKYFKKNNSMCMSNECLTFALPVIKDGVECEWKIRLNDIFKILIHHSEIKPVLIFFATSRTGYEIRQLLNMNKETGPYFDPDLMELKYQLVIVLPVKIDIETINIIKELCKHIEVIDIDSEICNAFTGIKLPENNNEIPTKAFGNTGKDVESVYFCRVMRIGRYEVSKSRIFAVSLKELTFCAPRLEDLLVIQLSILMDDIVQMEIGFSDISPVIFIYINKTAGKMIRSKLCMKHHSELCFYPLSRNPAENKIIILPSKISEENSVIQELIKWGKIKKLDEKTTSTILQESFQQTALITSNKSNNVTPLINNMKLYLKSNYVKIGAYKFKEKNVMISLKGFHLRVPLPGESTTFQNFDIDFKEITEVLYNFNKNNGVYISTTTNCFDRIKNLIRICDENKVSNSQHFSNKSLDENRIVIIFNEIPLTDKIILVNLLNQIQSKGITENIVG